ncbi:unnamed protein product [Pleuronectes platessa]|uniref:Uncharacterized protein n=1 Tax=Pleuronectes platessa TaxID=8262 RepID=A0A9N7TTX8_PLEPL|nr:unnamed protein product [Pleuronectes platessa]
MADPLPRADSWKQSSLARRTKSSRELLLTLHSDSRRTVIQEYHIKPNHSHEALPSPRLRAGASGLIKGIRSPFKRLCGLEVESCLINTEPSGLGFSMAPSLSCRSLQPTAWKLKNNDSRTHYKVPAPSTTPQVAAAQTPGPSNELIKRRRFHDASSGVGGGAADASPIRSCQELSEDRIQTHGQERPGQPAVTSLTLAETIHLAERGPPRVERTSPDPRLHAHEGRNDLSFPAAIDSSAASQWNHIVTLV